MQKDYLSNSSKCNCERNKKHKIGEYLNNCACVEKSFW